MSRVAIAGGTGGLGRTITGAIIATGKHAVFVLTRGASTSALSTSITQLPTDYTNSTAIASILKTHNIDTIISTLHTNTEAQSQAQLVLIEAAVLSETVVRFAPSEYGIDFLEAARLNFSFPGLPFKIRAITALLSTPLIYTRFVCGTFMDYLNFSSTHPSTYLQGIHLILDLENAKAVIPGNGQSKISFTHTTDVAKFVAAAISVDKWPEKFVIVGDRRPVGEIVGIAEEVKDTKFDKHFVSIDDLKAKKIPELSANVARYDVIPKGLCDAIFSAVGVAVVEGWLDFGGEGGGGDWGAVVRDAAPLSIREFLSQGK